MPDKPTPTPSEGADDGRELDAFMSAVISFASNIGKAATKAGGDGDESVVIGHNAMLVERNFAKVRGFTKENFSRLNAQDRVVLNEFLAMTDATEMARSGEKLAVQQLRSGRVGKGILTWISKYLTEIKKLIGWILGLFNGGKPPKWWTKIEQLIDELWNMLVELLGMIFGFDASALARELSQGEVNYLNEQLAVARLQNEYDRAGKSDED